MYIDSLCQVLSTQLNLVPKVINEAGVEDNFIMKLIKITSVYLLL